MKLTPQFLDIVESIVVEVKERGSISIRVVENAVGSVENRQKILELYGLGYGSWIDAMNNMVYEILAHSGSLHQKSLKYTTWSVIQSSPNAVQQLIREIRRTIQ